MATQISIAIDVMSGDLGLAISVPAALQALQFKSSLTLYLVGNQSDIHAAVGEYIHAIPHSEHSSIYARLEVVHADTVVGMSDKPAFALRQKKNSSMARSIQLVKEGVVSGCVSAGNTGALMVLSRSILGMFPGIDRPAITKKIPTPTGSTFILDLGANVNCQAEHLYQFGLLGSLLVEELGYSAKPKVALMNVGTEENKGNEQVKLAAQLLSEDEYVNFVGFVEGHDIFSGNIDVIVCDGFVGNVALKTSEGLARLFIQLLENAFTKHLYLRLLGWFVKPILSNVFKVIDPSLHNGAILLGVQGVVVKSHGAATISGFSESIQMAVQESNKELASTINQRLDNLLF